MAIDPLGLYTRCPPGMEWTDPALCDTMTEGGGGGGANRGGGGGPGLLALLLAWLLHSDSSQNDIDRQAEYEAYKKRCNETPPPGLSACDDAKWRLQRNKDCARMRRAWDNKWQPGRHATDISNLERGITNLEKWIADNCCQK